MNQHIIPEETIEEIRKAADIVDIISSRIQVKKTGKTYNARCPFHQEKTPSFYIHPERQIFKCFGCGKAGNVFHFLMAFEGKTFIESVRFLADRYGISLPKKNDELATPKQNENKEIYRVLEWAGAYFQGNLNSSKGHEAREYLDKRKISKESRERFSLGFALPEWDSLLYNAKRAGFSLDILNKAGLITERREKSGYYDRFRSRIIFPIWDRDGRIIGFGGRVLGETNPKYLNSPENSLFSKRKILYALHLARPSILKEEKLAVVEGYTDVLMAHQCGIPWIVGTMGTSLTSDHAQLISHHVKEVIVLYDGDMAGQKGALRSLSTFLEKGVLVKVAILPENLDPYDFLCRYSTESFMSILDKAEDFLDFLLKKTVENSSLDSITGRAKVAENLASFISMIPDRITRSIFLDKASQRLGISRELLISQSKQGRRSEENSKQLTELSQVHKFLQEADEAFLLKTIFLHPKLAPQIFSSYPPEAFLNSEMGKIAEIASKLFHEHGKVELAQLISSLNEKAAEKITNLCYTADETSEKWGGDVEQRLNIVFQAYQNRKAKEEAASMAQMLLSSKGQDEELENQILKKLPDLIRKQKRDL